MLDAIARTATATTTRATNNQKKKTRTTRISHTFRPYGMDSGIMIHSVRLYVCAGRRSCSGCCKLGTTHMLREEINWDTKCVFDFRSAFCSHNLHRFPMFPLSHSPHQPEVLNAQCSLKFVAIYSVLGLLSLWVNFFFKNSTILSLFSPSAGRVSFQFVCFVDFV